MHQYIAAYQKWKPEAEIAMDRFEDMTGHQLPRVPGCDTVIRLAWRMECGRTLQESVAREYIYRWSLALQSPIFGVPHALGM